MATPTPTSAAVQAVLCDFPPYLTQQYNVKGGIALHLVFILVSSICACLTCLVCFILAATHMVNYVNPQEQKLILRIVLLPAVYGIISLFSVIFYVAQPYLQPIPGIFEAVALCSIFELFVIWIVPVTTANRETFFQNLERRHIVRKRVKHNRGSLRWFRLTWLCVFQFLVMTIICAIATEVTATVLCPTSTSYKISTFVIHIVLAIVTTMAIVGTVRLYRRMRPTLKPHKALSKLVCFKLLVAIILLQNLALLALIKVNHYIPTSRASYYDLTRGIPAVLISLEMPLFSVLFLWAFSASSYRHALASAPLHGPGLAQRRGCGAALVDVLNVLDIVRGVGLAGKTLVQLPLGKVGYAATGNENFTVHMVERLDQRAKVEQPYQQDPNPNAAERLPQPSNYGPVA